MNFQTMSTEELENLLTTIQQQILIRKDKKVQKCKPDEIVKCNICTGSYTYKHKARHFKTQIHKTAEENLDALKRIARSKTLIARAGEY